MSAARQQRRAMAKQNAKRPSVLTQAPRYTWPEDGNDRRIDVWVSRDYLVQVFDEAGATRLSVNRTTLRADGRWDDRIEWDELQRIKRAVGYGDAYAIEVFPRDQDLVNVANMRHLWVMAEPLPYGWMKERGHNGC